MRIINESVIELLDHACGFCYQEWYSELWLTITANANHDTVSRRSTPSIYIRAFIKHSSVSAKNTTAGSTIKSIRVSAKVNYVISKIRFPLQNKQYWEFHKTKKLQTVQLQNNHNGYFALSIKILASLPSTIESELIRSCNKFVIKMSVIFQC